ncbi:hypothetical protein Tco_0545458 [Tanacetum coccineum]
MNSSTIVSRIHHTSSNGLRRPFQFLKGSSKTTTEGYMENYKNVSQDIRDELNAKAEAVQIILTGIDNDIYSTVDVTPPKSGSSGMETRYRVLGWSFGLRDGSIGSKETVDACPNACEMWKAIKRLKQGESINAQDLETNLYGIWNIHITGCELIKDNSPRIQLMELGMKIRGQLMVAGVGPCRECQKPKRAKDAAYHKEKMLLCKQEARVQLNADQADWKDDTDDESDDQELEAHYMYMAHQIIELLQIKEQGDTNIINYSLDICYDREHDDQDDTDELDQERDLLASLIEKLKCEIDDSKNRNKFMETSNKALVDKLKGDIEDFKTKNKSLESSNNHFKEANNELSKTNQLMFKDLKKFQAELDKYHDVNYASKVAIDCEKAKGDLMSYKIKFENSSNETISIMSQEKEAQIKLYKTREDKELDNVIALENKVKLLDDIVSKTGQSIQTMNMLNRNCKMSFAKPEFLKKDQRVNPRLYDIGCYNDNLGLMLAPESDEIIRLDKESRSKLRDLIRPFDYDQLNNLYDLFVPQQEKSPEQHYFSKTSK